MRCRFGSRGGKRTARYRAIRNKSENLSKKNEKSKKFGPSAPAETAWRNKNDSPRQRKRLVDLKTTFRPRGNDLFE